MGVKGLWTVLESLGALEGTEIDASELNNKILAVDVSIWLYQFVKSVPAGKDAALSPLVIGGLFQRVCKLLHFGIKPIFVFDGSAPVLKKETVALRQELRKKGQMDYSKLAKKILRNKLKLMALEQITNAEVKNDNGKDDKSNNLYDSQSKEKLEFKNDPFAAPIDLLAVLESSDYSDPEDDDFDEYSSLSAEIDTNSSGFKKLPYEIQEQILLESRKRTIDASQIQEKGSDSLEASKRGALDFSKAQVEALIKRRKLMDELESLRGNTSKQSNASKNTSHGIIASKSDKKYFFTKNVQAGWTLAYTDSQSNDTQKEEVITSFVNKNAKKDTEKSEKSEKTEKTEKTISDIDDDEEFMNLMFGDSKLEAIQPINTSKKEETFIEIPESSSEDEIVIFEEVKKKEISSEDDEFLLDLPPQKKKVEQLDIVEEEGYYEPEPESLNKKDSIKDESLISFRSVLIDERTMKLPEIILEGLIKSPSSEAEKEEYLSEDEEAVKEYESFIKQVKAAEHEHENVNDDKPSPEYKDLVDQIRSELREFNTLSESSALTSISPTKILIDAFMEMLHHFHLPFIVAPFEAEAQCAAIKGIDGIISEDSDCLLFGAEVLYRGFFGGPTSIKSKSSKKRNGIIRIESEKIFEKCGLARNDFIVLSYLLGCDYCTGIEGIGPKRALELVQQAKSDEILESLQKIVDLSDSKYQSWFKGKVSSDFIDLRVAQAFLNPIVNPVGVDELKWGKLDKKNLERFMNVNAKWPADKTSRFLQDLEKQAIRKRNFLQ